MDLIAVLIWLAGTILAAYAAHRRRRSPWRWIGAVVLTSIALFIGTALLAGAVPSPLWPMIALWAIALTPTAYLIGALCAPTPETLVQTGHAVAGWRKCPECAEVIRSEARKCRYCHSELVPPRTTDPLYIDPGER